MQPEGQLPRWRSSRHRADMFSFNYLKNKKNVAMFAPLRGYA
jgi:hypothetical protein